MAKLNGDLTMLEAESSTFASLLYRYAYTLDDGNIDEWPSFFVKDASYSLISRENYMRQKKICLMSCDNQAMMVDRVNAIQDASVFSPHQCRHYYTNVMTRPLAGDLTELRANYLLYQSDVQGDCTLLSVGRIEALVDNTELRFRKKTVIYDNERIPGLLVYPI